MTIRVGLIGAGVMESDHARIISEDIAGASLKAVCDASEAAAMQIADRCGALVVETDAFDLRSRKDVDADVIASPDGTHADLTLAALELKKPGVVSKYDGWLSIGHEDVLLNTLEGLEKSVALLKGVLSVAPSDYAPQAI